MHQNERRSLVFRALDSRGPVRLVAEDNVEGGRTIVLRAFDQPQRLIRAKDHRHRFWRCCPQRGRNLRRIGGNRDFQLPKRSVLVIATRPRVRADPDVAVRHRSLLGPFPHRLLQQRYRRHQIQHPLSRDGGLLSDAQRRERLAGAASHDQLAAIRRLEPRHHIRKRLALMRPQAERFAPNPQLLRILRCKVRPVDRPLREISETQHRAGRFQRLDRLPGVRPPLVAGIDDHSCSERLACRCGNERIQMRFRNLRTRRIALALDRAKAAPALFRNQINARIAAREVRPHRRPFGPQPHMGEPILVERIPRQIGLHQPLEQTALFDFGPGDRPQVVQHIFKAVFHESAVTSPSRCGPHAASLPHVPLPSPRHPSSRMPADIMNRAEFTVFHYRAGQMSVLRR